MPVVNTDIKFLCEGAVEMTMNATGHRDVIELEIFDDESHAKILTLQLTPGQVIGMLAGKGLYSHPVEWVRPDRIGWQRRNYTEEVEYKLCGGSDKKSQAFAKKMEEEIANSIDGPCDVSVHWRDLQNGHRTDKKRRGIQHVTVVVWEPPVRDTDGREPPE